MEQEAIRQARETKNGTSGKTPERDDGINDLGVSEEKRGNDRGKIAEEGQKRENLSEKWREETTGEVIKSKPDTLKGSGIFGKLFNNFKFDDLLLLGILFLLLNEDCDEDLIVIILFIFISGLK